MAEFAQLDDDNIVINVIDVADDDAPDEATGIAFCKNVLGEGTDWVQTSATGGIRNRLALKGMKFDEANDVFYYPSPYHPSWVLNTWAADRVDGAWEWEAPVSLPSDAGFDPDNRKFVEYTWDEDTTSWTNRKVVDLP
tara:strand:+ start:469 stop:882 length:414 start_codon:yes stop_codon:yes gene_type:complete